MGNNKEVYFIAEIGVNHEANIDLAKKIIKDAKKGGAHAVKLQCYKAENLASKYASSYWDKKEEKEDSQLKLYKKFDKFEKKDYEKIIKYCNKIKIDFIVTPFDIDSVKIFKNKVKYFKISSSDLTNYPLIKEIAKTNTPIILSTGASEYNEVIKTVKYIKSFKVKKIILLHCILNYPTKRYDANLNMIEHLKKTKLPVGLSDHSKPNDSHNILIYSYLKGVKFIEKHFTNNKKKSGNDHFHSFDKKDLIKFFSNINDVNKILGNNKKKCLISEKISRKNARRSLFYKKDIKANSVIKENDLISLRPSIGINPTNFQYFIGKKIKKNVKSGTLVKYSHFS